MKQNKILFYFPNSPHSGVFLDYSDKKYFLDIPDKQGWVSYDLYVSYKTLRRISHEIPDKNYLPDLYFGYSTNKIENVVLPPIFFNHGTLENKTFKSGDLFRYETKDPNRNFLILKQEELVFLPENSILTVLTEELIQDHFFLGEFTESNFLTKDINSLVSPREQEYIKIYKEMLEEIGMGGFINLENYDKK